MKLTNGLGDKNAANASMLDTKVLVVGMEALKKSIDALDKTFSNEGAPDSADNKTGEDGADTSLLADKKGALGDATKKGGEEAALPDTTLLEALNSAVRDTTLSFADFREKLGVILSPNGEGTAEGTDDGTSALAGIFGSDSEETSGELGEEKLSPEDELAKEQEMADASVAIEEGKKDTKKALGDQEQGDKKKKLEGIYNQSMKAAKALGLSEKQSAIGSTIISTAKAVAKANEKGFPVNIPLMAQAAAVGAAQLGVIKGQFHGGIDEVPNSGTYLLEKGERVVDRRLNADLKGYLGASGGGAAGGGKAGDNVNIANTVTMSFAEGTTEDQVYEAKMKFEEMFRDMYDEYATPNPFDRY